MARQRFVGDLIVPRLFELGFSGWDKLGDESCTVVIYPDRSLTKHAPTSR